MAARRGSDAKGGVNTCSFCQYSYCLDGCSKENTFFSNLHIDILIYANLWNYCKINVSKEKYLDVGVKYVLNKAETDLWCCHVFTVMVIL